METAIRKCLLYETCSYRTAVCAVREPDDGCYIYRYFENLVINNNKAKVKANIIATLANIPAEAFFKNKRTKMRIIKKGKLPIYMKKFTCTTCGCIFEADTSEYHATSQMGVMDGLPSYECKCPTCGKTVYAD